MEVNYAVDGRLLKVRISFLEHRGKIYKLAILTITQLPLRKGIRG